MRQAARYQPIQSENMPMLLWRDEICAGNAVIDREAFRR
jgi:hypothetical protein